MAKQFGGGHLVDLPGHGKSRGSDYRSTGATSFQSCADHVRTTFNHDKIRSIVGHSFGGRVALQYTAATAIQQSPESNANPASTWLLDTVPGQAHDSVMQVLEAVHSINLDSSVGDSRKRVAEALQREHSIDPPIAMWLTSSMVQSDTRLEWGFDVDVIQDVLPDFASQDFVGLVEQICKRAQSSIDGSEATKLHLVRGGRNAAWGLSPELLPKLDQLQREFAPHFQMHVLPHAGHWVHIDDLEGLVKLWHAHQ